MLKLTKKVLVTAIYIFTHLYMFCCVFGAMKDVLLNFCVPFCTLSSHQVVRMLIANSKTVALLQWKHTRRKFAQIRPETAERIKCV